MMSEERLYELAYEALLNKWGRENDFLQEHPENEISQIKEKELWNELLNLEYEMNLKQLARDLEKQGLRCDYDAKLNILFVSYLNFIEKLELNSLKINTGKFIFMIALEI